VIILNYVRDFFDSNPVAITDEMIAPLLDQRMIEAIPALSEMLGQTIGFEWLPPQPSVEATDVLSE
jgi:hypothetical protein